MLRSTEVAFHHLGNLRTKLVERKEADRSPCFSRRDRMVIDIAITDLDAEITALIAADAKLPDDIRMDTPDMLPTEEHKTV